MSYATVDFYKTEYFGATASDAEITSALARASLDIDMLNGGPLDTSKYETEQLEILSVATCAQAEGVLTGATDDFSGSVSLGDFSISGGKTVNGIVSKASEYLGLLNIGSRIVGTTRRRA